jgi:hypothetical protein
MIDFINFFKGVNYKDQDSERKALFLTYTSQVESTGIAIDILKNKLDKSAPTTLTTVQIDGDETIKTPVANVTTTVT